MHIALLTDFGTRDHYVGAMKGVILSIDADAKLIDISHEIGPQDIASAAFVLRSCYREFPTGTIFLCVVDPGVGSDRRAILALAEDRLFVGPDNGLFGFILRRDSVVHEITNEQYFRHPVSSTFHGRDIFAPAAAHLSRGVPPAELGAQIDDPVILADIVPYQIAPDRIDGRVIYIDRFGNLVTNITADLARRKFQLEVADHVVTDMRRTYAGAETGRPFAIKGSTGLIEISVNESSAAEKLNAQVGTPVMLKFI
jgi:S-adenosylmethionine hydrolase